MAQLVVTAAQQKDFLCGSFCASRILNELGFDTWGGDLLDEDLVALRAGGTLPAPDVPPVVPPGAASRQGYRFVLPIAPFDEAGTSPAGLIRVIEAATRGRLRAVPVRGPWTAGRVDGLVDRVTSLGARLIANVQTALLWGSHPSAEQLVAELQGQEVAGPPPDWDTGHFVELTFPVRGTRGSLIVVRDTYPALGLDGYHLQPPRALAAALQRTDGREGGVIVVGSEDRADEVRGLVSQLGLEVGTWNNGCRSDGNGDR
jgi:hypothetical protein